MRSYWIEVRRTLGLAGPIIMGQLGQMLMQIIDTVMVGRIGVVPLAGAALGGSIFTVILVFGFGLCAAVHVRVAQAYGAGQKERCATVLRHGVIIAIVYAVICGSGIHAGIDFLGKIGQPPDVVEQTKPYLVLIGWSLVPILTYQCFKNFCEAQNRQWLPFCVLFAGLFLKVILNWIFIFGRFGFPAWGLWGAGLSTMVTRVFMLGLLITVVAYSRRLVILEKVGSIFSFQASFFRQLLGLGVPSASQFLFEAGAFTMVSLMMGWISAQWLAAHQIAVQVAALSFMVPLGMSFAVAIRVGHAVGSEDRAAVRHIGFGAIGFAVCFMSLCALVLYNWRLELPTLFIDNPEVIRRASQLLVVAAIFQVFDGVQIVCLGALRGLADVKVPAVMIFCVYWGICIPSGYVFAFILKYQGLGLWFGLLIGLVTASIFLAIRFFLITRRVSSRAFATAVDE